MKNESVDFVDRTNETMESIYTFMQKHLKEVE